MKAKIKFFREVDVKSVKLKAGVRYWEDATVNGTQDTDGTLIPFRNGDLWEPEILIDEGRILGWPADVEADIHYKVCDQCSVYLKDEEGNIVAQRENDYVPNDLIPGEYGDYIIMTVDGSGKIKEWEPSLGEILEEED